MAWIRFFIGTPQRFLMTAAGLAVVYGLFYPQQVATAVRDLLNALMTAIAPFVQPLLILGFVFVGLGILLKAVWPRRR